MLNSILFTLLPLFLLTSAANCPGNIRSIQYNAGAGVYKAYCTNDKNGCPETLPGPNNDCSFAGKQEAEKKDYYNYSCMNREVLGNWVKDLEYKGYKCNRFVFG